MRELLPRQPLVPAVTTVACPIHASLGVLGRKWALLVLRDVAFFENARFSDFLRNSPGLTPRILSMRLRELRVEGFIRRVEKDGPDREITYDLTPKGWDAVPILTAFLGFGMTEYAMSSKQEG